MGLNFLSTSVSHGSVSSLSRCCIPDVMTVSVCCPTLPRWRDVTASRVIVCTLSSRGRQSRQLTRALITSPCQAESSRAPGARANKNRQQSSTGQSGVRRNSPRTEQHASGLLPARCVDWSTDPVNGHTRCTAVSRGWRRRRRRSRTKWFLFLVLGWTSFHGLQLISDVETKKEDGCKSLSTLPFRVHGSCVHSGLLCVISNCQLASHSICDGNRHALRSHLGTCRRSDELLSTDRPTDRRDGVYCKHAAVRAHFCKQFVHCARHKLAVSDDESLRTSHGGNSSVLSC